MSIIEPSLDPNSFKLGMRRLASGVSLITTRDNAGQPHGMIATSVVSVSAEPPTLLVCVNKSASCHDVIDIEGVFCINLLGDGDDEIAQIFSSSKTRDARFSGGDWREMATGSPAHAGSLASFDCEVRSRVEAGSHTIFIGQVVDTQLWVDVVQPLIYLNGGYARCA
ncbi:MAG: flavin reductase family protein [Rhizobiaceae bacterium]